MSGSKLYVGNLKEDVVREDLEKVFSPYGELRQVWVSYNPPGYAFVDFDDSKDAKEAVRALDRKTVLGSKIRVEFSWRAQSRYASEERGHYQSSSRRPFHPTHRCYECGERGHYAYDCEIRLKRGRKSDGRDRYERSPRRSSSRSRYSRHHRARSYSSPRHYRSRSSQSNDSYRDRKYRHRSSTSRSVSQHRYNRKSYRSDSEHRSSRDRRSCSKDVDNRSTRKESESSDSRIRNGDAKD